MVRSERARTVRSVKDIDAALEDWQKRNSTRRVVGVQGFKFGATHETEGYEVVVYYEDRPRTNVRVIWPPGFQAARTAQISYMQAFMNISSGIHEGQMIHIPNWMRGEQDWEKREDWISFTVERIDHYVDRGPDLQTEIWLKLVTVVEDNRKVMEMLTEVYGWTPEIATATRCDTKVRPWS